MDFRRVENQWFALQVKTRSEQACSHILRNKGYEEFLPLCPSDQTQSRPARENRQPLFPGYVFCRFSTDVRGPVMTTPGVIRIVGYGGVASPITHDEIANIQLIVSSGQRVWAVPYSGVGQSIRITRGPFRGAVGSLLKVKNSHRLIVSIDVLQRSAAVELNADSVEPMCARVSE